MSGKAPWPVRKGIFRSSGQSDFSPPARSPSPIVEMPMSPPPVGSPGVGKNPSGPPLSPLSPTSPRVTIVESPFSPPPQQQPTAPDFPKHSKSLSPPPRVNRGVRDIPIEVEREVAKIIVFKLRQC